MLAIFLLLLGGGNPNGLCSIIGQVLLWVAAILTLITGYAYMKIGMKHMIE
jgi:hypothetical protein